MMNARQWKLDLLPALLLALLVSACHGQSQATADAAYRADIMQWRADRLSALKAPDGYLNLAALAWLSPGVSTFGAAADNDIVFPESPAAHIGQFELTDEGVLMHVNKGVIVQFGGIPVTSILIADDNSDDPMTIQYGSLAWNVVKREGRYGIRLHDLSNPVVKSLTALPYFPINPALRVTARLQRYDKPHVVDVGTVIEGLGWRPESPGVVAFAIDGKDYELEAYASGDELFFVFGDATSKHDTYPAGRFLYAPLPDKSGMTVLDFNRAYSPPCAFNDFATCPVASPRNRLPIPINAGEKYDAGLHQHARISD